ncbi:MAG: M20/M25/M40 family metallo-hydrolase [Firmicutes bacterium]|nr:M20/M25/M40 family metallo-hydrolase [Bacillota bacterium]
MLASPVVDQVLGWCLRHLDELVDEVARIAGIPAPTGAEGRRAAYVAERMRQCGLAGVETDPVGNVLGRVLPPAGAGQPRILLAAHLDTVFPEETPLEIRRDGHLLRGPGVGDNAAGLAGLIGAGRLLVELADRLRGEVILAATVGEEGLGNLRGMRALMERYGDTVDYVLALDGTLGGMVRQAVGSRRLRLRVLAEGGHSWGAFGAPSAVHSLCRMVAAIADLPVPSNPKTTYNVGLIRGGTSVNTIAAEAEAVLDLRSLDPRELDRLERRVRRSVAAIAARDGVRVEVELLGERPAGEVPESHPLCQVVRAVHRRLGIQTRVYPSSTDGNIPLAMGIPAVTIGVTVGANGHRVDEYIETRPLARGVAQVVLAVLALQEVPLPQPGRRRSVAG